MYAKAAVTSAHLLLGATTVVSTLLASSVTAKDKLVTVSIQVSPQGLDLSQPADAQTFYTRLDNVPDGFDGCGSALTPGANFRYPNSGEMRPRY